MSKNKTKNRIVIVYGRFNPLTYAHDLMIEHARSYAHKNRYDFKIFTTHTHDKKKNPLSYEEKIKILEHLYGSHYIQIFNKSDIFSIIEFLERSNYDEIEIFVGGDRIKHFKELINDQYKDDFTSKIILTPFANRNKYNISATEMREWACSGDYMKFMKNSPEKMSDSMKLEIYRKVAIKMQRFVRNNNESVRHTLSSSFTFSE